MNRNINYDENKSLEEEDIGRNTPLYEIDLYNKNYLIALGKERTLISKKNHYYFPVYLIHNNTVEQQIGAFEYESSEKTETDRISPFLDEEGDLDINLLGDIILYNFSDYDFFKNSSLDISPIEIQQIEERYKSNKTVNKIIEIEDDEDEDDEDDILQLKPTEITKSKAIEQSEYLLKDGVFTIDRNKKRPDSLLEETKEQSQKMKKDFQESSKNKWIESFMKNNNYDIVETLSNGDCFFDGIRIAYSQIGYITTVDKLRAMVATEATDDIFQQYRNLYLGAVGNKSQIEKDMKKIEQTNRDLKKRIERVNEQSERDKMKQAAVQLTKDYSKLREEMQIADGYIKEFKFMNGVDTIEKLREVIKTSLYWADAWSIFTLEQKLNVKLIILSEESYKNNDKNSVLQCGYSNNNENTDLSPNFYIMVSYTGNHYSLISYKSKYIFKFPEIPYDIKIIVTIKCMEKNSGIYSKIQDFRNFESKLGINPDDGYCADDDDDSNPDYDSNIVFMYYHKSNPLPKAGKGSNEKIPNEKIIEFTDLNLKTNTDWRKKLDDYWTAPFTLNSKKWSSVEHYYQASKFRKTNPDFYNLFSLDSANSDFSKDVEIAHAAGSKTGKYKTKILRPSTVKIDPDFYGGRNQEEREQALFAKFSQNEDLKKILLSTKNAKLIKYVAKSEPEKDCLLMKVRKSILGNMNQIN